MLIENNIPRCPRLVIKARRRDYLSDVVTLRSGDVEALALERRVRPGRLLSHLRPAMVEPSGH